MATKKKTKRKTKRKTAAPKRVRKRPTKPAPKDGANRAPNDGKGRPKGAVNKITKAVREALQRSFEQVGGYRWLVKLAKENPKAYATLLAKCLPHQVVGEDDGPIQFQKIERRIVDPAAEEEK